MSTVSVKEKTRRVREETETEGCVLLGIEPSGKIAFAQIGDGEAPAGDQVSDVLRDRYPNLAYVALVPARVVHVRPEAGHPNRPK